MYRVVNWSGDPCGLSVDYPPLAFWDAAEIYDAEAARSAAANEREMLFAQALKAIIENRTTDAAQVAQDLCRSATDSIMHCRSRELLEAALMSANRWKELADFYVQDTLFVDSAKSIRSLVEAFAAAPSPRIDFPALPFDMPIELNAPGLPMVEVVVNGHRKKFIVDTGAAFTVLSSDFARECGVQPAENAQVSAGTSTSRRVGIEPAILDSLRIGKLVFRSHPSVIIQSSDLRFRLFGFLTLFEIDGILGWNAIRELELQIDYRNKLLTIREPQALPSTHRNLFELNQPMIIAKNAPGKRCHFFLDTGSNATTITDHFLTRLHTGQLKRSRWTLIGGAGGMQSYESKVLSSELFFLNETSIEICNLRTEPPMDDTFYKRDGVLGSDILQTGSILIDRFNGRCEFILEGDSVK
jgi:hypothetical protein